MNANSFAVLVAATLALTPGRGPAKAGHYTSRVSVAAAAQGFGPGDPEKPIPTGPVPRTHDGKPDLQGFWVARAPGAPNMNEGIEEHPASFQNPGGKSVIVDPPDGAIPYQPWALAERDLRRLPESSFDDPEFHCFPAGIPRQTYINLHQILQTPTTVQFLYEFAHLFRTIPLDGRAHLPSGIRLWEGDSVGHWDGDTLVVDTTNNNGRSWFEQTGNFMSDTAHQIERFAMVDSNTIKYQVTISDPKVLTRPFTMAFPLKRAAAGNFELLEYACHEGNEDFEHMKAVQDAGGGRPKR